MHNYYITPKEYDIAEKNGISKVNLYNRIRILKWDKQRAITTPVGKGKSINMVVAPPKSKAIIIKPKLSDYWQQQFYDCFRNW